MTQPPPTSSPSMLKEYLDSFKSIEHLDAWAKVWHLTGHEEVVEKRKTLSSVPLPVPQGDIFTVQTRETSRFKNTMTETVYDIKFHDALLNQPIVFLYDHLEKMFEKVLSLIAGNASDLVRIYIDHPDLAAPVLFPPTPLAQLRANQIMDEISRVLQSAEGLRLSAAMSIHVGLLNMREAGRTFPLLDTHLRKGGLFHKKSVLCMNSFPPDNLCVSRALILGLAHGRRKESEEKIQNFRRLQQNKKLLTRDALDLHTSGLWAHSRGL